MAGDSPGMRQRTRRPSRRVSASRIVLAARHNSSADAAAMAGAHRRGGQPVVEHGGHCSYRARSVGLIQHKREAYWFYRFLSLGYDRWVNPLFWTPEMRARALAQAGLTDADLT